jgi:hypothetical protein
LLRQVVRKEKGGRGSLEYLVVMNKFIQFLGGVIDEIQTAKLGEPKLWRIVLNTSTAYFLPRRGLTRLKRVRLRRKRRKGKR